MTVNTKPPKLLSASLAERALADTEKPADAVAALVVGASMILDRDFGPEAAAQIMLNLFAGARETLIGRGLVVEVTRH